VGVKPPFNSTDFVDAIILNVSRDLPFSRNQPLQSADNYEYVKILKNKIQNFVLDDV
jgi:hypothetical protein